MEQCRLLLVAGVGMLSVRTIPSLIWALISTTVRTLPSPLDPRDSIAGTSFIVDDSPATSRPSGIGTMGIGTM
ncbi:MAG: hypothetical protein KDA99_04090, partial [Planctomycetales bacterium]|nr:hypothetical protein [Planctomycetales bacterium]